MRFVLADAEHVESDFVGVCDLVDEIAHVIGRCEPYLRVVIGESEAVDPDLHRASSTRNAPSYSRCATLTV